MSDTRHDGCSARSGATAHAGSHKHHICPCQCLFDLIQGFLGRACADLRVGTGAKAAGDLFADDHLNGGIGFTQSLTVGVDSHKLHTADICRDHAIHRIVAAAAHADDANYHAALKIIIGFKGHYVILRFHKSRTVAPCKIPSA